MVKNRVRRRPPAMCHWRAIFIATSTATDPESTRNTCSRATGVRARSRRASPTAGSCVSPPNMTCAIESSCRYTAASSSGTAYPWMAHHHDDIPSTTSRGAPPRSRSRSRMPRADSTRYGSWGVTADEYGCHRCARSNASSSEVESCSPEGVIAAHCVGRRGDPRAPGGSGGVADRLGLEGQAREQGPQPSVQRGVDEAAVVERLECPTHAHRVGQHVCTGDPEHAHAVLTGPLRSARRATGAEHRGGLADDRRGPARAGQPDDRVLEGARQRAVVLGGDEQEGVRVGDGFPQVTRDLGQDVVVVELLRVVRQLAEPLEEGAVHPGREVVDGGVGELAVRGAGAQAADEDEDVHRDSRGRRWVGSAIGADQVVEQSTTHRHSTLDGKGVAWGLFSVTIYR